MHRKVLDMTMVAGSLSGWLFWGGLTGLPPLMPNPRRTLRPVVTGYAGQNFLTITPQTSDTFTFDLSVLLSGQTITAVINPILELADATPPGDSNPTSRLMAGPTIDVSRTLVSLRIGALQAGVAVNYRIGVVVQDSLGNIFDSFATLPVDPRTDAAWMN